MTAHREGFAGLLGLVITLAIILIMASLYFTLTASPAPGESAEPGADRPGGAVPALRAAHQAELTIRQVEVRQAVAAFQALEGRWPVSIEELKQNGMTITDPPDGYVYAYDPATGEVTLKKRDQ